AAAGTSQREPDMKIAFAEPSLPETGVLVVGVLEGGGLTPTAAGLDERLGGAIGRAIAGSRFTGKPRQLLDLLAPAGLGLDRILLVGLGKAEALDARAAEELGGAV